MGLLVAVLSGNKDGVICYRVLSPLAHRDRFRSQSKRWFRSVSARVTSGMSHPDRGEGACEVIEEQDQHRLAAMVDE